MVLLDGLDEPLAVAGRPPRRHSADSLGRVAGGPDQFSRVRGRVAHRNDDPVDADIENPFDPNQTVPGGSDDGPDVAGSGGRRSSQVGDGLEDHLGVFRINDNELERG